MSGKKYLDSEKVIMLLRKDLICKYPSSFSFGLWAAADEIAKMDGEDVRPVKRGEWVGYPDCLKYPNAYSADHIVCSICEECFSVLDNDVGRFDFCPHCGADMRTEAENG